jgi:hypothetical protein
MLVVQMAINNVVDMIAMRHGFVATAWPVNMPFFMT